MEPPSLQHRTGQILDSVGEGIYVIDASGLVVFENAASAAMLGAGGLMAGRPIHDFVHSRRENGAPYPREQCPAHRTLRDGLTRRVPDEYYWRADGTGFPVDLTCSAIRDSSGAVTGAVICFRDVTERREAARQLERERARLVAAQAVAMVGSWETDLATMTVAWSEETYRIFETDPAIFQPTHEGFLELVHPEDRARVSAAFLESLGDESARSVEHRVILPGGRCKVVEARWRAFADETGRIVKAIGTSRDITERRRTESLLRDSEEKFSKLFESNPAKIAIGSMDGRMLDVNRAYADFLGYTREEMRGRTIAELGIVDPQEFQRLLSFGDRPGTAMRDVEVNMRTRNRELRRVLMSAEIITLSQVPCRVATLLDITALRQAEEDRRTLQAQALRAQRMESIGTLAGGIAHDLNNSLSPIKMSLELLRTRFPDAESSEILNTLEGCVTHAAEMVRQVLSFARGVEGQRVAVDPMTVAKDIRRIVQDTFPKSISCALSAGPALPAVIGDPTQLHQVLLNLCLNARDAMPGGGTLSIFIDRVALAEPAVSRLHGARAGDFIRITVSDTGMGIRAENREKVFEPFFTTKEVGQGTGLGLSTALAIVKSHGGGLALESELGKGSSFMVYLPAGAPAAGPADPAATAIPHGRGEMILLVDDDAVIRGMARKTLESYGYRVIVACDGREAVAAYVQNRDQIAVVLTDMSMPVMDGAALAAALRTLNPGVVIIVSSGRGIGDESSLNARTKRELVLLKPYSTQELLRTVTQALDARGRPEAGLDAA